MKNRIIALLGVFGLALAALLVAPVATTGSDPYLAIEQTGPNETTVSLQGAEPPAATAQAGNCDLGGSLCGAIANHIPIAIGIIHNWGESYSRLLYPGQHSDDIWKDTDGFYIGSGVSVLLCAPGGYCSRFRGPQNIKITNVWAWEEWNVYNLQRF